MGQKRLNFGSLREEVGSFREERPSKRPEIGSLREEIHSPRPEVGSQREELPSKRLDVDFRREKFESLRIKAGSLRAETLLRKKEKMRLWSVSTTVRNPERIRSFLKVLKELEGEVWNKDTQKKYQILLLQKKVYGINQPEGERIR